MSRSWNSWWAFHRIQLRAAAVQRPWAEARGTLPKVPMPWHPPVLVIAVRDEWWEDWESGTYPINSGMSRVFYLPQHRTLSARNPLALRHMRSTGCWVSADGSQFWKFLGSLPGLEPRLAFYHSTALLMCIRRFLWSFEESNVKFWTHVHVIHQ